MLAAELGLAGIRPVVLDPMPDPIRDPAPMALSAKGFGFWTAAVCTARSREQTGRLGARRARCLRPSPSTSRWCRSANVHAPMQQPRLGSGALGAGRPNTSRHSLGAQVTGFDQDANGVTVHVSGPDGDYELRAEYARSAPTAAPARPASGRHRFPGHDVARCSCPGSRSTCCRRPVGRSGQRRARRPASPYPASGFHRAERCFRLRRPGARRR